MQEHEGLQVVRGDLYPGGLKCSAFTDILFEEISNDEVRQSPLVGSPASLWSIPERLSEPARIPPPWPSASYYDAKIWQVLRMHAKPGDLVWNIA
jgi:hypothetical protein